MKNKHKLSLGNRSNLPYPHNAIYEILVGRCNNLSDKKLVKVTKYNEEIVNAYYKMFNKLPGEIQIVYKHIFKEGYTIADVAGMLGKSKSTIYKWLGRIYSYSKDGMLLVSELFDANYVFSTKAITPDYITDYIDSFTFGLAEEDTVIKIINSFSEGKQVQAIAKELNLGVAQVCCHLIQYTKYFRMRNIM